MAQMGTDDDEDADLIVDALSKRASNLALADVGLDGMAEMYGVTREEAETQLVAAAQAQLDRCG